jgi:type III pantothenate kinase
MNIYVDIGNSNTVFGFSPCKGKYSDLRVETNNIFNCYLTRKLLLAGIKKTRKKETEVKAIVICSVVPAAQKALNKILCAVFPKTKIFIIGKQIELKIKNKYKKPEDVGQDRLINAVAVKAEYCLPALVVDFGTAITIDAISQKGEYLGGIIVPGINLSLAALHANTALLPKLKAERPSTVLGRNTKGSILSGVFYGYASLVDGLIVRLKLELWPDTKKKVRVIATGGHLKLMKKLVKRIDFFDPRLTIKGIEKAYLASKKNEKQR